MKLLPLDRGFDRRPVEEVSSRRAGLEPPSGDVDSPHEADSGLCVRVLEEGADGGGPRFPPAPASAHGAGQEPGALTAEQPVASPGRRVAAGGGAPATRP